jgi:hypothetical protein
MAAFVYTFVSSILPLVTKNMSPLKIFSQTLENTNIDNYYIIYLETCNYVSFMCRLVFKILAKSLKFEEFIL